MPDFDYLSLSNNPSFHRFPNVKQTCQKLPIFNRVYAWVKNKIGIILYDLYSQKNQERWLDVFSCSKMKSITHKAGPRDTLLRYCSNIIALIWIILNAEYKNNIFLNFSWSWRLFWVLQWAWNARDQNEKWPTHGENVQAKH